MAIRPEIALGVRVPDVGQTFSNILLNTERFDKIRQERSEAPIRQRLLEAQTGAAEAAVPTGQERFNQDEINRISSLAQGASEIIPDLQAGNVDRVRATLQRRGAALDQANIPRNDTDEAIGLLETNPQELLRVSQQAVKLGTQLAPSKKGVQFGAQQTFKDSENNLFFGTTKRNPATGQVESVLSPVSAGVTEPVGAVNLVSGLGLTATEKSEIDAATAGAKEAAKLAEQAAARPEIEEKVQAAKTKAAAQAKRQQLHMDNGIDAADATANIRRGLELIRSVPTGGISAVSLKAQQLFGVEGADEAELSARLGKAVLSQLRATFGAAFTEREGARLENIEAGFGKSTEGNKRLLKQTLKILERKARRGITAAESAGDTDGVREIQEALILTLEEGVPGEARKAAAQAPATTAAPTGGAIQFDRTGQRIQ